MDNKGGNGKLMMDNNTENNNTENMNTENNETEMSMQDLMDLYENPVKIGQIIKGKIIQLDDKEAIVGLVGASHDGKLVLEETPADSEEKLSDILKVGQEIEAKVIRDHRKMIHFLFFQWLKCIGKKHLEI